MIVIGQRRLDMGLPLRHVVAAEHAAMAPAGGIHGLGAAAEAVDRLGHKALAPDLAHRLDAFLAAAGALGDLGAFRVGCAALLLAEQSIALRQAPTSAG